MVVFIGAGRNINCYSGRPGSCLPLPAELGAFDAAALGVPRLQFDPAALPPRVEIRLGMGQGAQLAVHQGLAAAVADACQAAGSTDPTASEEVLLYCACLVYFLGADVALHSLSLSLGTTTLVYGPGRERVCVMLSC